MTESSGTFETARPTAETFVEVEVEVMAVVRGMIMIRELILEEYLMFVIGQ